MTQGVDPEDDHAAASASDESGAPLSWDAFERLLAAALRRMPDESFLILSTPPGDDGASYYVQFAHGESWGLRAEAVGNRNLPATRALTAAQDTRFDELGWQRPAKEDAGRNFFRAWPVPVPFEEVARLAVVTLHDVYGIAAPSELRHVHQAFDRGAVAEPDLGIEAGRRASPPLLQQRTGRALAELVPLVERGIKRWLGLDELARDADGDYPIRIGSALMYVRVLDGMPPLVRIFSPILRDITESAVLIAALNDVNGRIRFGRVFWTGRQVLAVMDLTAVDITADQIAFACVELGNLADYLDDVFHGRFGGATMFDTRATLVN